MDRLEKSIIITGATSGIGRELAAQCIEKGYRVGGTGRRVENLREMKEQFGDRFYYRQMDVTRFDEARNRLIELAEEMDGVDIIVLNAGIIRFQSATAVESDQKVIDVNVSGFVQLANAALDYFVSRGRGQIVGISSIAALLGYGKSSAYNASKAFISNYMQGLRQKVRRTDADITITDVKPGFVESAMTAGREKDIFWVAPADVATRQILRSIEKRKNYAYITRRWRLIAWVVYLVPNWILDRL